MQILTCQTLKIFWEHALCYRWQLIVIAGGTFFVTVLQTYTPILYRDLLNLLAAGSSPTTIELALRLVVLILALNFVKIISWRVVNFVNNYFQPRVMRDLENTCYQYLQKHSYGFFSSNFVGSLVTKVRRYERAFEQISDQIIFDLGRSFLDTAMILAVLFWQYQYLGWVVLGWAGVFLGFVYVYSRFKLPYDIRRAAADTNTTAQLADSITNNVNIKLFSNYPIENKRFGEVTQTQFRLRKKSWDLGTIGDAIQGVMMICLEFWIIYIAVKYFAQGIFSIGDIALLQAYLLRIFDKLWNAGRNIRNIYEAIADGNEMTQMLLQPHSVQDLPHAKKLRVRAGRIEFRSVFFGYHAETNVFKGFNLEVRASERVALIGPSGGGKSTIVKLLLRLSDVRQGEILIDGQNIAQVTQDSLRATLAFVPQEPILFHRSLMENIRYARPSAKDAEVIRAAKLAHAHEFVISFPQAYETLVGERGIKLSGGERQRIAIARAILKDAPILVLDEATSSLDSESEMYIQQALKQLMKGRTTIVIAHRLSTIMQMDRIVVIDGGKIVEEGRHEELLKAGQGTYQKLWEIQAGGFART